VDISQLLGRLLRTYEPPSRPLPVWLGPWARGVRSFVSPQRLRADVSLLAGPRSRLFAPDGMNRAELALTKMLQDAGWRAGAHRFEFSEVVGYRDKPDQGPEDPYTTYQHLAGANVLAWKRGSSGGPAFLVGAHLDTVSDSPGADDNASGVAAMVELARVLAPFEFEHDVLLVAFDMEELGSFGARALVGDLDGREDIAAAIVLESIGYTSRTEGSQSLPAGIGILYPAQVAKLRRRRRTGDSIIVIFRRSSLLAARAINDGLASGARPVPALLVREPTDIPVLGRLVARIAPWVSDFSRSDHVEFWRRDLPAVQLTDTANFRNPHYHQTTDVPETLDYRTLADVVAATAIALAMLAGLKNKDTAALNDDGNCAS
jgi:Peptidase family M28